ncbi:glutamate ABC transporter substrate-binding protein [Sciscionella sediminilitoris]|uniref:glutamate ABC transporter substrate-binding protein n=1 Tax=Sciscionella sediminilitoris TaxID=1445613 RepID=UPI0004DF3794|nr:glutamate ABC transporter substrate-binding protein [Sciscionella sp. SE31]
MSLRPSARKTVTALAVTAALALSGCSGESPSRAERKTNFIDRAPVATEAQINSSPTAAAIQARGQMLIGSDKNLPLVSQQNPTTGQTEGFDATLSRMLAKYITGQSTPRIVSVTPENREQLLQAGTVDAVIRIYSITEKRARQVTFAGPYFDSGQTIATLRTDHAIQTADDLRGRKVCVVKDTTSEKAVTQKEPEAAVTPVADSSQCVSALEQGKAEAYVHDLTVVAGAAQLNNKIKIVGNPFTSEPYGIGIRHGDDSFKNFIDDWLRNIERSGLWRQAWQQSLGTVVPGGPPSPPNIGGAPGT